MSDLVGQATMYSSSATSVVVTVTGCGTELKKITVGIQKPSKSFFGTYKKPNVTMLVSQADFTAYKTRVDEDTPFPFTLHLNGSTILWYIYDDVTIPSVAKVVVTSVSVAPNSGTRASGVVVSEELPAAVMAASASK